MRIPWKTTLKFATVLFFVVICLSLLDLYTTQWVLEDPGPYVVARHSDTPDQVIGALRKLQSDPSITTRQIDTLIRRYREHAADTTASPSDRKTWLRALDLARKLRSRAARSPSPVP